MKNILSALSRALDKLQDLKLKKSEPLTAEDWSFLGIYYNSIERYDDALTAFRQSIHINPEDTNILYYLGKAYYKLGRYDDALKALRQSLHINPEDADTWIGLGNVYNIIKRHDDAIEAYNQAIRINPEDFSPYLGIEIAIRKLEDADRGT